MHTLSIDDKSYNLIKEMAASGNRSEAAVIHDAINKQLEFEKHEYAAMQVGLKQAEDGETVSHAEMVEYVESLNEA